MSRNRRNTTKPRKEPRQPAPGDRRQHITRLLTIGALGAAAAGVPALLLTRVASTNAEVRVQARQVRLDVVHSATLKLSELSQVNLLRILRPSRLDTDKECVRASAGSDSVAFMSDSAARPALSLSDLDLVAGDRLALRVENELLFVTQERPTRDKFDQKRPIEVAFKPDPSATVEVLTQPPAPSECMLPAERIHASAPALLSIQASLPRANDATVQLIDSELSVNAVDFEEHIERNIEEINIVTDQSAVAVATIRFPRLGSQPIELGSGEPLHVVALDARLVELHCGRPGLDLRLQGTISDLEGGRPLRNLMPTRLQAMQKDNELALWWAAVGYVCGLGIGVLKLLGFWKVTS